MNAPDPCPRCGSACEAVRGPVPDRWGVRCLECGLWADDREATEAAAIAAWNLRAAVAPQPSPEPQEELGILQSRVSEIRLAFEKVESQITDVGEFTERAWEQLRSAIKEASK